MELFIRQFVVAYIVRKRPSDMLPWLSFASVQFLDLIAFTLELPEIEKASYAPDDNPFSRTYLDLPYFHSLSGAIPFTY